MRFLIILLMVTLFTSSCAEKKNEQRIALKVDLVQDIDFSKIPDSLEIIFDQKLIGDFNGDDNLDFASLVKNKQNNKVGVIVLHEFNNEELFVFGAGEEIDGMTDLNWVQIFETLPKGDVIAPTIFDKETGDIIGKDKSKSFKLTGNGIILGANEVHAAVIIFWNGSEYQWYHKE